MDKIASDSDIFTMRNASGIELSVSLCGGCLHALKWRGEDMLRPASSRHAGPTDCAAFPMFPFSGRIGNARFRIGEKLISLPQNWPPEPHAIHGFSWDQPWMMKRQESCDLTITHAHSASEWPWDYEATQHFTLLKAGLLLRLSLTNRSNSLMPAGMGWHPYFPAHSATLQADVTSIWKAGENGLPSDPSDLTDRSDIRTSCKIGDLSLDDCFAVGEGGSAVHWSDTGLSIRMKASESLRHLVVFTPKGEAFFCVEPVSHVPNAVSLDHPPELTGLRMLAPGETLSGQIEMNFARN